MKRFLASVLAFTLAFSMVSTNALASGNEAKIPPATQESTEIVESETMQESPVLQPDFDVAGETKGNTSYLYERFDDGIPDTWTVQSIPASASYAWSYGIDYDGAGGIGGANAIATGGNTGNATRLISPFLDLSGAAEDGALLSFSMINPKSRTNKRDQLLVFYRVGLHGSWTEIKAYKAANAAWTEKRVKLPEGAYTNDVQICFAAVNADGLGVGLDNIRLEDCFNIFYDANGGSGTMSEQYGYYREEVFLKENEFTAPDENMVFAGWNQEPHGAGYDRCQGFRQTLYYNHLTYYAQWVTKPTSLDESFEDGNIPGAWTLVTSETDKDFLWYVKTGINSACPDAHDGEKNACIYNSKYNQDEAWLLTPWLDLSAMEDAKLEFWYGSRAYYGDYLKFGTYYRVEGGDWQELFYTESGTESWTQVKMDLPEGAITASTQIGFKAVDTGYGSLGVDAVRSLIMRIFIRSRMMPMAGAVR